MKIIKLEPGHHQKGSVIWLHFSYDEQLHQLVRQANACWSATHQCWYLPATKGVVNQLLQVVKGRAWVDYQALKQAPKPRKLRNQQAALPKVNGNLDRDIRAFVDWMRNRRYSEKTITTYEECLWVFFRFLDGKAPAEVTHADLERFQKKFVLAGGYSRSFQSQVINAVKLFFSNRQHRQLNPELVERPKKEKKLPNVLSKEEVKQILEAPANLKHRAMLSLIYACGLRRSELLNLKLKDVDAKRKLLIVRGAKGKKDRIVPLSDKVLTMLREYYKYSRPQAYLFEGYKTGEQYSEGSLQKVLKNALQKAGIQKPVTLHWLRHSYATHLLENGTDLRYIQEILGHKSSKTTELYTHVTDNSIKQIKTPFDDL
jgi:site-specific recombinase XerD